MKRPTQLDVAKIAGVSRATVSFVVNGLTDGRVPISEDTRRRVLLAVAELGYEPDARARALRSGDTKIIELIIPDIRNPHYWDNISGIQEELQSAGYRLLLSHLGQRNEYGDEVFENLLGQRIDGVILMGSYIDQSELATKTFNLLQKRRLAIVEINDHLSKGHLVDNLVSDYRAATKELMAHLLGLQHTRIGFIYGVATSDLGTDRLKPYQEALIDAGIGVDPNLILRCGPTIAEGYQAARQLLDLPHRPTAVIAINDMLAIAVLRAAADIGLQVPEDLSVVGFDDILIDPYLTPRLTSVAKDAVGMGRKAARMLLERIANPDQPRQVVQFLAKVILRESTGPARL